MSDGDKHWLKGCTCFRLRRTTRRMTQIYDAALAAVDLTLTQYSLLSALVRQPTPPTMQELADLMGMERTSLSRTLKPMIERGFLRIEIGADRRSKQIIVTDTGQAQREAARPVWRAAQDQIQERLGKTRTADLHKLLDQCFERLDQEQSTPNGGIHPT